MRSCSMTTAPLILTIDDLQIERVSIYKYLGIWLDEKLAFDVHIDYLVKRLQKDWVFFFGKKKDFPLELERELYRVLFYPF